MRLISLGRLLGIGSALFALAACTSGGESEEPEATGGSAAGDGDGDGDMTGDGDGDGDGDDPVGGDPDAVACTTPASDFVIDFTYDATTATSETDGSFGDFTTTFSGGTFTYGAGLVSDVTDSNWHISGSVEDYSGLAVYFSKGDAGCTLVDASAFSGIELTISGDSGGSPIQINVGTAGNSISTAWFVANGGEDTPNHGRCAPASDNQYDGTCSSGMASIPVTDTPTTVQLAWEDFTGEMPADSFDPAEITFIGWNFAWAGAADTPYNVDVVIDDIKFMP
jgi:hypothetical protein